MTMLNIRVADIIEVKNHTGGTDLYSVMGIYLGALGSDSLVELAPLTQAKGSIGHKPANALVPVRMIESGVESGAFTHSSG
jgi:hypothetical protein